MHTGTESTVMSVVSQRFVLLPENRAACAAVRRLALAIRRRRRFAGGILYLHGATGVGKSHLASWLRRTCRTETVMSLPASDCSSPAKEMRSCGLLIVEDLQHLPAWAADQFRQLLDHRMAFGRATLVTANCGPADLPLPSRLINRFACALILRLAAPDCSSRRKLIKRLASQQKIPLTRRLLNWLANHGPYSARQLRAAVHELTSNTSTASGPVDVDDLRERWGVGRPSITVDRILECVAAHFDVSVKALRGADRHPGIMLPRHLSMYLARRCMNWPLAQIGRCFGRRDASSVRHAIRRIQVALAGDPSLAATVCALKEELTRDGRAEKSSIDS